MKKKIILELNDWEAARLVNLVRDGIQILKHQDRTQRGIDGYTLSELEWLKELLSPIPQIEHADTELFDK